MKAPTLAVLAVSLLLPRVAFAQDASVRWRRAGGQVLGGTPNDFTPHEWRFGFNVTRLLALGR